MTPVTPRPPSNPLAPREFLILLALAEGPQHGYGILKAVEQESSGDVRLDPANLYRTLKRLHRQGLVAETGSSARNAGYERRRSFRLTEFGRGVVRAEALRLHRLATDVRLRKLIPKSEMSR